MANEFHLIMSRNKVHLSLLGLMVLPLGSAHADEATGVYAVARAGGAFNPESKFDINALPGSSASDNTVKYKIAPTGEIGAGYDFGSFRLEQTLGYTSSNAKDVPSRVRAYSLTISGYADIPISKVIVPYVGGGMGAVRIDTQLSWPVDITGIGREFESKSWGPFWHLDSGISFHVAPRFTVELGGRYSQTFSMRRVGNSNRVVEVSELRGASATLGLRYLF